VNPVILAILVVASIGLVCGVILAAASKVMSVPVDERFGPVRECLPGANCGACGFAGCDAYAQALLDDPEVKPNRCVPGGAEAAKKIAAVLGVESGDVVPMMAHVRCNGTCDNTQKRFTFNGEQTCKAVRMFCGGNGTCAFGCLGCGDCASVCPQDAICIENGIAHVDPRRCIGCALCSKACPNHIIEMIPKSSKVTVDCSNKDKGPVAMKVCKASCIGCMKCQKNCPTGAITVKDFVASIDQSLCSGCGVCADGCPKHCITKH